MYNLGTQFQFSLDAAKGNEKATVLGQKFRITVLTESLVRLEYSETGEFEDRPSERVWYRNFPKPEFYFQTDGKYLEIKTRNFILTYQKDSHFHANSFNPSANLKITVLETDKVWYYKHPEARNYTSPCGEFDKNDNLRRIKGLFSTDGFTSIDDSNTMVFNADGTLGKRKGSQIDVYVFTYGTLFYRCLDEYYKITGYPALVPRYALGVWWYKDDTYNDYTLSSLLNNFQAKGVPISVLTLNNDWHLRKAANEPNIVNSFTFDANNFKEPLKMINYLHNKKICLGLTINPNGNITKADSLYQMALKYVAADRKGQIPFNVFDNLFLDVYFKIFVHSLTNMNIDFFRIESTKDLNVRFYLNHYHSLDFKAINNKRSLLLTHDSYLAPHRYPVIATGESHISWETLRKMCEYNVNLANRGITWATHAYGGFAKGIEEAELYLRFIQLATFSSIFLLASARGKYYKKEPWKWDYHTFVVTREFMLQRQKLVPYLYTEGYKFTKKGFPLIEPIFYRYPELYDDEICRYEYFFGSELFVSPILAPKEEIMKRSIHRFFLPSGIWYDIYTGKKFVGNKKYVLFYTDETYPVFASSGAIIPYGTNESINDVGNPTSLEINIFPGSSNNYTLYEDDGITEQYKKNFSFQTEIEFKYLPNDYEIIIRPKEGNLTVNYPTRNYKIVLKNVRDTASVKAEVNLKAYPFNKYASGNDLIVELNNVSTNSRLVVKCQGKDIEVSNIHVINEDIEGIISDIQIDTELKNQVDAIIFSNNDIRRKRVEIRKLKGLEPRFANLFLKLLEYIAANSN